MFRTTIQHLAARKLRLLTTSIAVILGVAFMAGTLVLTDTIGRTFDNLFADVHAGTDAYVRGASSFSGRSGDLRPRLDAGVVDDVAHVEGVAAAEAMIQGYAQILDRDGDPIGDPATGAPTYGGNWLRNDDLNAFTLVDGRAPERDGEIVIDRGSAKLADYQVGDRTAVLTQSGRVPATIVGIAAFGTADNPAGASFALFTREAAERVIASPGKIDGIGVVATDGLPQAEIRDRIADVVPAGVEVITGDELTAESQSDIKEGLGFFNTFLLTFALIALFVGSFIIYNTFSILVAQRSKEMALLRALGASRRQVLGSVLLEAVAVGLIASLSGLGLGVGVAALLKALLAGMGIDIPAGGVVISSGTVITSLVAGTVVSVASAVFPARKAAKTPPVAAMRDVALDTSGRSRRRLLTGGAITAVGAASMANGLAAGEISNVGLGAAVVFIGVAVLGPLLARPLARLIGAPLPRVLGLSGTLARENAMRNPKRTAATASALMIGVALVGFITILATSTKASIDAAVDKAFTGDFVVDSGAFGFGGLSPELAERLNDLPEVEAATGVRVTQAQVHGSTTDLLGADATKIGTIFDLGTVEGSFDALDAGSIAVFRGEAEARGLALGDEVTVRFAETGDRVLTVAAIYGEDDLAGDYFLGLDAYEANVADQFDFQVFITVAEGTTTEEADTAITTLAAEYPQAEVEDRAEYKASQAESINQMLNLVYALLALAIFIALIGIANTLALSIFERTRELGLLRAVGMTRRQLRSVVRWESVIVALLGSVMGLAIGVFFSWAVVDALASEGVTDFVVPGGQLLVITVLAGLSGVAAAVLPARRAARLDVLGAIASS